MRRTLVAIGLLLFSFSPALAREPGPRALAVRARYAKHEYRIPMRDGKRLFTSVYLPNDVLWGKRYPILLMRTPYSVAPYGPDKYSEVLGPSEAFEKEGYIFVFQDVRGRNLSEGDFVNMRPSRRGAESIDESTDTYDTIDWLVKHVQGNNGKVGMYGTSYPGFYAAAGAIDSHPALKAVSPQAPIADWWRGDDMHRNGAFNLQMAFTFFSFFAAPRPQPTTEQPKSLDFKSADAYQYFLHLGSIAAAEKRFGFASSFWKDIVQHPDYDAFWQDRNLLPRLHGMHCALLIVGGWFDTEDLYGPLNIYRAVREQNRGVHPTLFMGPWFHGGWHHSPGRQLGDTDFGFKTSQVFEEVLFHFFQFHLKGVGESNLPGALVFETGANRWRSFSHWPPQTHSERFYLGGDSRLSLKQPSEDGRDEYVSDPNHPVPYSAVTPTDHWSRDYMAEDQRFASRRPDVLVYQTEPLESSVTVAGPLRVDLWTATSGTDADWVVKLVDVTPPPKEESGQGDLQLLVRGEPFRARYRESLSKPMPMAPGEPTPIRYSINDVCHTFLKGHRIMVQIQSTWFPFIDRNPQRYVENIYRAMPGDFQRATQTVLTGPSHPSSVELPILKNPDEDF